MLRAIVLSLVLLWSGLACAQVTLDANATAAVSGLVSGTITNNNLTVGTGSNRCLVAQLNFYSGGATPTGVAVTWNGVSLTQIGTEGTAFLFGLVNPASGNHALVATWTGGSLYAALNGTSFTNCAQTGTFINVNTATGSSPPTSLAITNPSGNIAIDSVASTEPLSSPSQTQLFVDNTNSDSGSSYSASVNPTFSWSWSCTAANNYLARTSGGNEGGNAANITALICGLVADGVITGNLSGSTGGCGAHLDALYILAQQNERDAELNLCGTTYGLTLSVCPRTY
jgi:hypothetical protein